MTQEAEAVTHALAPALLSAALAAVMAAGLAALLTGRLTRLLRRQQILDRPNDRSSHTEPTPRGGGLAVMAAILLVWLPFGWWFGDARGVWLVGGAVVLSAVSFADDVRTLGFGPRMGAQIAVVALLLAVPATGQAIGGVFGPWMPPKVELVGLALAWLWFVNLYNFMDGIDGITGVETITIAVGGWMAFTLGIASGSLPTQTASMSSQVLLAALAGGAVGFLVHNWHPARIFLGDVGSIPLGLLLGYALLTLASAGGWAAAILLPMYYLMDATLTLLRRAARGERVWVAHRQHAYQCAVRGALSHDAVSRRIAALNTALIALAILTVLPVPDHWPALLVDWALVGIGTLLTAGLIRHFHRCETR